MPLTIGDFARLGGVSTRMLRHYDRIGLLRPRRVDAVSGYRYYEAAQLTRLNQLVALKDVGFTLDEIGGLLDADPATTHEQLVRRRAELAAGIEADQRRLAAVDARLSLLADDGEAGLAFVSKPLPRLRLFQLTGQVEDAAELGERVGPLFGRLAGLLASRHVPAPLPSSGWYESPGDVMRFGVGYPASGPTPDGVELGDLPAYPAALTVVHSGAIHRVTGTWQALAREADRRGLTPSGPGREVYHECPQDRPDEWVTELQLPVAGPA